jgi:hypothetical protein
VPKQRCGGWECLGILDTYSKLNMQNLYINKAVFTLHHPNNGNKSSIMTIVLTRELTMSFYSRCVKISSIPPKKLPQSV